MSTGLQFLRPFLSTGSLVERSVYIRFFHTARSLARTNQRKLKLGSPLLMNSKGFSTCLNVSSAQFTPRHEVEQRIKELEGANALVYPRLESYGRVLSIADFRKHYESIGFINEKREEMTTLQGMLYISKREGLRN